MQWMALWPGPPLQIPKARGTDDTIVIDTNNRKGLSSAGVFPGQRHIDIVGYSNGALRDGSPLIKKRISTCCCHKPLNMAMRQRLQTDTCALQLNVIILHPFQNATSAYASARMGSPDPRLTEW